MHLDDRLQALADFVPEGARAADIGTDHGYLAVALLQQGKANFVVAGDKNRGPYEAAKRTVHEYAISEEQISVRLGDGLEVVKPGEVDTVCIAGMGGILMNTILEASPEVTEALKTLVLQPMNGAPELREWLYDHEWHIVDENLVIDDGAGKLKLLLFIIAMLCQIPQEFFFIVDLKDHSGDLRGRSMGIFLRNKAL